MQCHLIGIGSSGNQVVAHTILETSKSCSAWNKLSAARSAVPLKLRSALSKIVIFYAKKTRAKCGLSKGKRFVEKKNTAQHEISGKKIHAKLSSSRTRTHIINHRGRTITEWLITICSVYDCSAAVISFSFSVYRLRIVCSRFQH